MSQDRELLELAAKAAGFQKRQYQNWAGMDVRYGFDYAIWTGDEYWNPLTDDGDALRLSVSQCIDVLHRFVGGQRVEALAPGGPMVAESCTPESRAEATRRAIVKAAAAIGKRKV